MNFKEICVNWVGIQNWDAQQKATLAFYLMTSGKKPELSSSQVVEVVAWLQFLTDTESKKAQVRSLLSNQRPLSREQFLAFVAKHEGALFNLK